MLLKGNSILLFVGDLVQYGVSLETIKSGLKRNRAGHQTWKHVAFPDDKRVKLIFYDSLPEATKVKLPPAAELLAIIKAEHTDRKDKERQGSELFLPDLIEKHYETIDYHYYLNYLSNKVKASDLMQGAGILRFLASYKSKSDTSKIGFPSKSDLRAAVLDYIINSAEERKRHLYGFKVTNSAILQQKELNWRKAYEQAFEHHSNEPKHVIEQRAKEAQLNTLLHNNRGNNNALVFDKEHQAIVLELYLRANKLDMFRTWLDYQQICKQTLGMQACTYSTIKKYLSSDRIRALAAERRHGQQYAEVTYRPYHHRRRPDYSFSLVAGDGWFPGRSVLVNFNDRRTGKPVKRSQTCAVWLWYDWKSEAIVGFDIAPSETGELIRQSFRQILTIHNDVCPASVMLDRSWTEREDIQQLFRAAGVAIQDKRAYNPKSNIAERFNKELNKLHRQVDEQWASMTNNTPNFKHNPDNLKGAKSMDEADFRAMIRDLINIYNNTPLNKYDGRTRLEMLAAGMPENPHKIDALDRVRIFGRSTVVTIRNGAFNVTIATRKYEYEVPEWHKLVGKTARHNKVRVCFDEAYMETVDIYRFEDENDDSRDTYLTTCKQILRYNPAQVEQTEKDRQILGHHEKRGAEWDKWVEEELNRHEQVMNDMDLAGGVKAASQERYKEALSSAMAGLYNDVHMDMDRHRGYKTASLPGKSLEEKQRELDRKKWERRNAKGGTE